MIIMISGKWLRVPTQLLTCEELTRADIAVWCYVADRIGDAAEPVPRAAIMAACELSESTVKRALRKLVELHYLHAQERPGAPTIFRQTILDPKKRGSSKQKGAGEDPEKIQRLEKYKKVINVF